MNNIGIVTEAEFVNNSVRRTRPTIRAEIINSSRCSAEGYTACGNAPVLGLCRELVKAGFDPSRPLHAYRGATLCLIVRSIRQGARLTVKDRPFGPVFERWVPFSYPPVSPR